QQVTSIRVVIDQQDLGLQHGSTPGNWQRWQEAQGKCTIDCEKKPTTLSGASDSRQRRASAALPSASGAFLYLTEYRFCGFLVE
ncbi:MAG: hypothetical protein P8129_06025, partial [Anaerolineae bacterium]